MPTTVNEFNNNILFNGVQKVAWDWVSSTGGAVSNQTLHKYSGTAYKLITIPSSSTGLVPTALYDVQIFDEDGLDVLCGKGSSRSATVTEYKSVSDGLGAVLESKLTLTIANAGASKAGKAILFLAG